MPTNALFLPAASAVSASSASPGTSGQSQVVCPLKDSAWERRHRRAKGRDGIAQLELANSFYCPSGRWPSRGWVLVRRGDFNQFANKYATNFQLNFTDVETGTSVTFQNLAIIQARCVSRAILADPEAVYLVELTDARGLLRSPWFCFPTTSQYNVVAPAYPGSYYSDSMNGANPWTWSQMIGDLWVQMGPFLGAFGGLPFAPTGTPENFAYPGTSAWKALNDVLDLLGMTISANPLLSAYGIVTDGAADAAFAALLTTYAGVLEDDLEWIDLGSGRVPGSMEVYFHRINQYYGTEETVRSDALQWQSTPGYSVSVAAPALFAGAAGFGYLWDDFMVRFDVDGNPLGADVATANAIALERVSQYYARIYRGTSGFMTQRYTGALPFVTGSLVDGVSWTQDYRDGRAGWTTTIKRGERPAWEHLEYDEPD